jgi:flagellar P-ring protein FlgI
VEKLMVGTYILVRSKLALGIALAGLMLAALALPAQAARLKDIAQLDGVRDNQLIGFGLVGGLAGTGDDPKSAPYTAEAITNMLGAWGFNYEPAQVNVKNFAAVMVTADLPAYQRGGDRLDITISSIGSAKSLEGGVLYPTLLKGADQQVYAVGQGQVSLGAEIGGGGGGGARKAHKTVGRVPEGALVENTVPSTVLKNDGTLRYNLQQPDFTTANAIAAAINKELKGNLAYAVDAGAIAVAVPAKSRGNLVPLIARLENLDVTPGGLSRVVVNQRTGTLVLGGEASILPVSITHNGMVLTFGMPKPAASETAPADSAATGATQALPAPGQTAAPPAAAQPAAAGGGKNTTQVQRLDTLGPTTAADVAEALAKMNLAPSDVAAIFEAIDAAGALLGSLEVI